MPRFTLVKPIDKPRPKPPNAWTELHSFRLEVWDESVAEMFLKSWQERIPSNCECRESWKILIEKNPPVFTTHADFFEWGVDRHNDINAKLSKPFMPLDEAWELYRIGRKLLISIENSEVRADQVFDSEQFESDLKHFPKSYMTIESPK